MLKRVLQKISPTFLLRYYKRKQFYKSIRDFNIVEEPDLLVAQKLVKANSAMLDIGANIGLYIKFLSPLVKRVVGFEPVPFTFSMLQHNAAKFGWKNVELHQIAVSSKDGQSTIEIPIQAGVRNYFRAALSEPEHPSDSDFSFNIQTRSLDSWIRESNLTEEISLVKCDTEGHELAVVKGSANFLKTHKPAWLMEISGNPDEPASESAQLCDMLSRHQYEMYFFRDHKLIKRQKGDTSINYFFLQKEHVELIKRSGTKVIAE